MDHIVVAAAPRRCETAVFPLARWRHAGGAFERYVDAAAIQPGAKRCALAENPSPVDGSRRGQQRRHAGAHHGTLGERRSVERSRARVADGESGRPACWSACSGRAP